MNCQSVSFDSVPFPREASENSKISYENLDGFGKILNLRIEESESNSAKSLVEKSVLGLDLKVLNLEIESTENIVKNIEMDNLETESQETIEKPEVDEALLIPIIFNIDSELSEKMETRESLGLSNIQYAPEDMAPIKGSIEAEDSNCEKPKKIEIIKGFEALGIKTDLKAIDHSILVENSESLDKITKELNFQNADGLVQESIKESKTVIDRTAILHNSEGVETIEPFEVSGKISKENSIMKADSKTKNKLETSKITGLEKSEIIETLESKEVQKLSTDLKIKENAIVSEMDKTDPEGKSKGDKISNNDILKEASRSTVMDADIQGNNKSDFQNLFARNQIAFEESGSNEPNIMDSASLVRQMSKSIETGIEGNKSFIKLNLNPEWFGEMSINIVKTPEGISARISAEKDIVGKLLSDSRTEIALLFEDKNIKLENIVIETRESSDTGSRGYSSDGRENGSNPGEGFSRESSSGNEGHDRRDNLTLETIRDSGEKLGMGMEKLKNTEYSSSHGINVFV